MVIEHVFITTLDATETLRRAAKFLSANGFVSNVENAFQLSQGWNVLDMTRGKSNAGRAKSIDQLPQRIRMEWDRGRVTIAASILAAANTGALLSSHTELPAHSPKARIHIELMAAFTQSLELLLAHGQAPEDSIGPIVQAMLKVNEDSQRRRRRSQIIILVVIFIFALLIGLAIFAATQNR